jgi:hypothetical protein
MENVHSRIKAQPDSERSPSCLNQATWSSISYLATDLALELLLKAVKNGTERI